MTPADLVRPPREVPELDPVAEEVLRRRTPCSEAEVLRGLWEAGEEARLDEDVRFVQVAPGRWVHVEHQPADVHLEAALRAGWDGRDWEGRLERLDQDLGGRHVLLLEGSALRLEGDGRLALARLSFRLRPEPLEGEECLPLHTAESAGRWLSGAEPPGPRGFLVLESPEAPPEGAFLVEVADRSLEPGYREGALLLLVPGAGEGLHLLARDGAFRFGFPAPGSEPLAAVLRAIEPGEVEFEGPDRAGRPPASEADLDRRLERLARRRNLHVQELKPAPRSAARSWRWTPELALSGDAQRLLVLFPPREFGPEVEQVEVEGRARAAGAFTRPVALEVPPHDGVYRVRAWRGGVSEPLEDGACPGLEPEAATAFPVPVGGLSRRTRAPLVRGRSYRLVTPPARRGTARRLVHEGHASRVGVLPGPKVFDVLELAVPRGEAPRLDRLLARLGLVRAAAGLELEVGPGLPDRLQETPSGEVLEVFDGAVPLRLQVRAPRDLGPGEACLLLVGPDASLRELLPAGSSWEAELRDAAPGLWLAELRSRAGDLETARASFVLEHPLQEPAPVPAAWHAAWGGQVLRPGQVAPPADLAGGLAGLDLRLPPLWPLEATWQGLAGAGEGQRLRADGEGRVDVVNLRGRLRAFLGQQGVARVGFSAGELGSVAFLHEALQDEGTLVERLRRVAGRVDLELLDFDPLEDRLDQWILPVLRALSLEPAGPAGLEGFPVAVGTLHEGVPALEAFAWLQPVETLGDPASDPGLQAARERAGAGGLELAVATDGVRWALQRTRTRLRLAPALHDLREALEDSEPGRLLDFLRDLGG